MRPNLRRHCWAGDREPWRWSPGGGFPIPVPWPRNLAARRGCRLRVAGQCRAGFWSSPRSGAFGDGIGHAGSRAGPRSSLRDRCRMPYCDAPIRHRESRPAASSRCSPTLAPSLDRVNAVTTSRKPGWRVKHRHGRNRPSHAELPRPPMYYHCTAPPLPGPLEIDVGPGGSRIGVALTHLHAALQHARYTGTRFYRGESSRRGLADHDTAVGHQSAWATMSSAGTYRRLQ